MAASIMPADASPPAASRSVRPSKPGAASASSSSPCRAIGRLFPLGAPNRATRPRLALAHILTGARRFSTTARIIERAFACTSAVSPASGGRRERAHGLIPVSPYRRQGGHQPAHRGRRHAPRSDRPAAHRPSRRAPPRGHPGRARLVRRHRRGAGSPRPYRPPPQRRLAAEGHPLQAGHGSPRSEPPDAALRRWLRGARDPSRPGPDHQGRPRQPRGLPQRPQHARRPARSRRGPHRQRERRGGRAGDR